MHKLGFIGLGNMGFSILSGLISDDNSKEFTFYEISDQIIDRIENEYGIKSARSLEDLCSNSKYILLAIKPQNYKEIIEQISDYLNDDSIIITIAPGFSTEDIKAILGKDFKIVRSMPNTPALVSEGMSCISFSDNEFTQSEREDIVNIFNSCGKVEVIPENYMDAVVPVSGSSPAYIYILIEAMADAGVSMGLTRELSYRLASQAVLGSAKMVIETNRHPAELKDAVCSPGGTTIAAVRELEKNGFRSSLIEAMQKAFERGIELKNL
ncbi:MAG: pyrroline-5-carboxylate reductase [Andreesenia angusta]|nr:pyrroline-5-carboxylate reductase [Andreesenia angusta]